MCGHTPLLTPPVRPSLVSPPFVWNNPPTSSSPLIRCRPPPTANNQPPSPPPSQAFPTPSSGQAHWRTALPRAPPSSPSPPPGTGASCERTWQTCWWGRPPARWPPARLLPPSIAPSTWRETAARGTRGGEQPPLQQLLLGVGGKGRGWRGRRSACAWPRAMGGGRQCGWVGARPPTAHPDSPPRCLEGADSVRRAAHLPREGSGPAPAAGRPRPRFGFPLSSVVSPLTAWYPSPHLVRLSRCGVLTFPASPTAHARAPHPPTTPCPPAGCC